MSITGQFLGPFLQNDMSLNPSNGAGTANSAAEYGSYAPARGLVGAAEGLWEDLERSAKPNTHRGVQGAGSGTNDGSKINQTTSITFSKGRLHREQDVTTGDSWSECKVAPVCNPRVYT